MSNYDYMFNKQEREEHRVALAQMYQETEYVKASSRSARAWDLVGFKKFASKACDNIRLEVDNRGGFCNRCQHYHFRYPYGIELLRKVQEFEQYEDYEILVVTIYVDPITGIEKSAKAWRPLMIFAGEHWVGKYKIGAMIKCYWNPDDGKDCMSFGNQPAEGIVNAGAHPSEWSTFEDGYGEDVPEKTGSPAQKKKSRRSSFLDGIFDEALADNEVSLKQHFPDLYD